MSETQNENERGICPQCRTEQALNKDGTLRKHGDCPAGLRPVTGDQPDEPPADPGPDEDGVFRWDLTIAQPALYVNDTAWQRANAEHAENLARDAGHTVVGEAECVGVETTEDGAGLTLTYHVPIET